MSEQEKFPRVKARTEALKNTVRIYRIKEGFRNPAYDEFLNKEGAKKNDELRELEQLLKCREALERLLESLDEKRFDAAEVIQAGAQAQAALEGR